MSHVALQDIWISSVRLQSNLHVVYSTQPRKPAFFVNQSLREDIRLNLTDYIFVEWESLREKDNAQRLLLL